MSEQDKEQQDGSAGFSFVPREMTDDNIARSIASNSKRRRTQGILLAASAGFIVLLGMFLIGFDEENIEVQVSVEKADVEKSGSIHLQGLSYRGVTQDGNDFVLLAETASENEQKPDQVLMTSPRARVDTDTGNPITIRANEGDFSRSENTVNLTGRVVIVRPDLGYTLLSDQVFTNLDTGVMVSDTPVRGFSPTTRINADGMVIAEEARDILFTGKSRIILNQGQ